MNSVRLVAIALCVAMVLAMGCAVADEGSKLEVEVGGSQGNGLIPAGMASNMLASNPIMRGAIEDFTWDDIELLFELIKDAEAVPTQLEKGRYEFDVDGSGISGYLKPFLGDGFSFLLEGMRGKPETLLTFSYGDALADDYLEYHYYLLSSEELKAHVLELCQWDTYALTELKDTQGIIISEISFGEDEERIYNPVVKIENAEQIKAVTDGIARAKVKESRDSLPPMVRLEFKFEDGRTKYAYMRTSPLASSMEAGGQQIVIDKKTMKVIRDWLPRLERFDLHD